MSPFCVKRTRSNTWRREDKKLGWFISLNFDGDNSGSKRNLWGLGKYNNETNLHSRVRVLLYTGKSTPLTDKPARFKWQAQISEPTMRLLPKKLFIRAQWDFKNCLEELAHMFFNVKLNFKVGFFWIFFDLSTPWGRKMHICKCMGISMGKWPKKNKMAKNHFSGVQNGSQSV